MLLRKALVWLIILSSSISLFAQKQNQESNDLIAERFYNLLLDGKYGEARSYFSKEMLEALDSTNLAIVFLMMPNQFGSIQSKENIIKTPKGFYDQYQLPLVFKERTIDIKILINPSGQVSSLQFIQVRKREKYEYPNYVDTIKKAWKEEEIQFESSGLIFKGSLFIPQGKKVKKTVILVHGSGPNDRFSSIGPNKIFKDIALFLAQNGIAVICYDKRTYAFPGYGNKDSLTVKEEVIDDVNALISWIKTNKKLKKSKIYLAGHSLGASLAARIANQNPEIKALILLAPAASSLEDLVIDQIEYLLSRSISSDIEDSILLEMKKSRDALKNYYQSGQYDTSVDLFLNISLKYWDDLNKNPFIESFKSNNLPKLFCFGGRDYQVNPIQMRLFENARISYSKFLFFPDLNHLFIYGSGTPGPEEYEEPGHFDREVLLNILQWINETKI